MYVEAFTSNIHYTLHSKQHESSSQDANIASVSTTLASRHDQDNAVNYLSHFLSRLSSLILHLFTSHTGCIVRLHVITS